MHMQPKLLLYVLAWSTVIFSSCTKDDTPVEPIATSKFLINGTLIEWNGKGGGRDVCFLCGPQIIQSPTGFLNFVTTPPQNSFEGLILTIYSKELQITTYS